MKKFITLVLTLMLTLTAVFGLTACGEDSDYEFIKNKGTLNVGITLYEPMDYFDEDGETIIGFDAEVAKAVGEKLGLNVSFVIIKWSNKVAELNSKAIDCIWNGMTVNDDLKANISLSKSYAENKQVAVIQKSNETTINSVDTVKNSTIAVESGSAGNTVASDTLKIEGTKLNAVTSQLDALTEVKTGNSQVAIIDLTMASSVVGKGDFSNLMIVDTSAVSFNDEEFAVGFRKGSDMTDKVNEILVDFYKDGTLQKIAEKYSGSIKLMELK